MAIKNNNTCINIEFVNQSNTYLPYGCKNCQTHRNDTATHFSGAVCEEINQMCSESSNEMLIQTDDITATEAIFYTFHQRAHNLRFDCIVAN